MSSEKSKAVRFRGHSDDTPTSKSKIPVANICRNVTADVSTSKKLAELKNCDSGPERVF
jgi:hypothetical protein